MSCSGGGRRQSVWVPGVHLGSRALCSPEEQEAVLEGSRQDADLHRQGPVGPFLQPWLAMHCKTLKITEALGRKQTRGWEAAGGSGAVHQAGAEALEAKEPHVGSPKPRYCLLPGQGRKCQGLDLPFSTWATLGTRCDRAQHLPPWWGMGSFPAPPIPIHRELPLHLGGCTGPQTHPPVSGFLGLTSVHWIVCETAELPTAKQMD